MHLDPEELLELLHGDVSPEQAGTYLDHLDECPGCSASFDLMVELRAHRREALGALALADVPADPTPRPEPIPHPASMPMPAHSSWATHGLRLAASLALAGLLGILLWSAPIVPLSGPGPDSGTLQAMAGMATDEFTQVLLLQPRGKDVRLTAGSAEYVAVEEAVGYLESGRPEMAVAALSAVRSEQGESEPVQLYLGIAQYLAGDAAAATSTLRPLEQSGEASVWRAASWYGANALLKLGRAAEARAVLQRLTDPPEGEPTRGSLFHRQAENLAQQLEALLGNESS